jgi:arabinofuranosyltransferase
VFAVVLVRTAWACDDAFITFRVIDNALHGWGLRWNVAERVQVYTHPLWLLALIPLSAFVEPYYGSMLLGGGLTLALVGWFLWRGAAGTDLAVVAFLALLGSQAFVDFSTSGLENPLAHVLLVAAAVRFAALGPEPSWRERAAVVGLASLVAVDRLDHAVLVAPLVLSTLARARPRDALRALAVGSLPLVAWEVFAVVYYGFPLPNTAYAKLGTGIPSVALARQGLQYLETCFCWDPLTAFVLGLGVVAAVISRGPGDLEIAAAICLWLVYLVRVGGDHMAGRFLTPAFVLALLVIVRKERRFARPLGVAVIVLAAYAHHPPVATGVDLVDIVLGDGLVSDERAFFYRISGLLRRPIDGPLWRMPGASDGKAARLLGPQTIQREMIGWYAYYAGPDTHVVDPLGLGDPLIARIPASADYYRAGHYRRTIPEGYLAAAREGGDVLDPGLDGYWRELREVTRGPIFSVERWRDVRDLNRPGIDPRVDAWCQVSCSVWHEVNTVAFDRPMWLPPDGMGVRPDPPRTVRRVRVYGDPGSYRVLALKGGEIVVDQALSIGLDGTPGEARLPPTTPDEIRVLTDPRGQDLHLGGILLGPAPQRPVSPP